MRTTVHLPDALAEAVKAKAAREHRTFTSLVEEGLRAVLAADVDDVQLDPLPESGERGGSFLIDLEDRDTLWAVLDADDIGGAPAPATRPSPKNAPR